MVASRIPNGKIIQGLTGCSMPEGYELA